MTKRVGILIGGGDVPGLNMCLKSLVYRIIDLGYEPIGVRKGWEGLIQYDPDAPSTYSDNFIELTKNMVRPIDRTPGAYLHSTRLNPRQTPSAMVPESLRKDQAETCDMSDHIRDVIRRLDYLALIVIGDDDALHYTAYLHQQGVPVIGIPKTIHNNIHGTDYSLGFSTGLARGVSFIHELRALAGSREQVVVVETFAAKSGYSTLLMAFLAGADRVLIPEVPYDPERLAWLAQQDKRQTPANYAVVVACDGTQVQADKMEKYRAWMPLKDLEQGSGQDYHSLVGSGIIATRLLSHLLAEEVLYQPLTYLLRTGPPDGQDLLGAANFAMLAARMLHESRFGRMTAFVQDRMWTDVDINVALEGVKQVDINAWYDEDNYKPQLSLIWSVEN